MQNGTTLRFAYAFHYERAAFRFQSGAMCTRVSKQESHDSCVITTRDAGNKKAADIKVSENHPSLPLRRPLISEFTKSPAELSACNVRARARSDVAKYDIRP